MKRIKYEVIKPLIYSKELMDSYSTNSVAGGSLIGKTVLITGATGGIGISLTKRFIAEKCNVLLIGRDNKKLDDLKNELEKSGTGSIIKVLELDLTDLNCGNILTQFIENESLMIDVLINNAGVFTEIDRKRRFRVVTEEQFNTVFDANYIGTKITSKAVADYMVRNKISGTIINISSICAIQRKFQYTPYGISKSAVIKLTEDMRDEYPFLNIKCIAPGSVATRMGDLGEGSNISKKLGVLNRVALPEEIATLAAFLSSDIGREISNGALLASACEVL